MEITISYQLKEVIYKLNIFNNYFECNIEVDTISSKSNYPRAPIWSGVPGVTHFEQCPSSVEQIMLILEFSTDEIEWECIYSLSFQRNSIQYQG